MSEEPTELDGLTGEAQETEGAERAEAGEGVIIIEESAEEAGDVHAEDPADEASEIYEPEG